MPDPLGWVGPALADLERRGLRRFPHHRATRAGRMVDGLVNLSSNDYLGLAGDPRLADAAAEAATTWGAGAGASRLVTGGTALHRELEKAVAAWKRTEDAVVFSSGYLANCGTIPALVGPGDAVLSDELNHASIVDACRLSRAQVLVYPHGDVKALEGLLDREAAGAGRRLIVTDGVFSMDGDAADLPALCAAADAHDTMVMVDDAHGCGVIGPDGRGTAALQGCAERVGVHMGTLSKAFGAAGGYVAGSGDLCEWLRNRARAYVFDTAPPPPVAAAALAGLHIAHGEPWRRERAVDLARRLGEGLAGLAALSPAHAESSPGPAGGHAESSPGPAGPANAADPPPGPAGPADPAQSSPRVHPASPRSGNARNQEETARESHEQVHPVSPMRQN
ncbi:MAG TPA: 8-amino-7-oxononanoate synthase, partial [Egibacteraceae bacterium]|nr:8-amino-7-oxononanoate synthase [Egibacteraceae bacterium]